MRWIFLLAILTGCVYTPLSPSEGNLSLIELPEGISIEEYADVPGARSLAHGPDETIIVGTRGEGKVYLIEKGDVKVLLEGLNSPNGVAYKDGKLYVAEISKVTEYNFEDLTDNRVIQEFPDDRVHGWKFIAIGPDNKLYVPVGSPCNVCDEQDPYSTITRMNLDGSEFEIYARGIRNTVGFDWHPETEELWFTDNGRDWLGNNRPPDELNHAPQQGMHFGFPYCHANISDPDYDRDCSQYTPPVVELGPHVAALGMRFYDHDRFEGKIFIAEHGSWNRDVPIGYRIMVVDPEEKTYEVFASGWLQGRESWGRPVDVLVLDDGALLVSDDKAGKVYRIS